LVIIGEDNPAFKDVIGLIHLIMTSICMKKSIYLD